MRTKTEGLTGAEKTLLRYIINYVKENKIIPTRKEMSKHLNVIDKPYVGTLLARLNRKGHISIINGVSIRHNDVELKTVEGEIVKVYKESYVTIGDNEEDILSVIEQCVENNNFIPPFEYIQEKCRGLDKTEVKKIVYKLKRNRCLDLYKDIPNVTKQQYEMLTYINNFIIENDYSPSIRELCKISGYSSTSTVHGIVTKLVEKGLLTKEINCPRTLAGVDNTLEDSDTLLDYLEKTINKLNIDLNKDTKINKDIIKMYTAVEFKTTISIINQLIDKKHKGIDMSKNKCVDIIQKAVELDKILNELNQ